MMLHDKDQDIYREVRKKAENYFGRGYNCAQAVALSNVEVLKGQTDGIIQMAAGFGQGVGAGCICGALAGGVMTIGLLLGGPGTSGFDREILDAAAKLHQRFIDKFGLACCRGLRKKLSLFNNARCREITVTTAEITLELILAGKEQKSTPVGVHPFKF